MLVVFAWSVALAASADDMVSYRDITFTGDGEFSANVVNITDSRLTNVSIHVVVTNAEGNATHGDKTISVGDLAPRAGKVVTENFGEIFGEFHYTISASGEVADAEKSGADDSAGTDGGSQDTTPSELSFSGIGPKTMSPVTLSAGEQIFSYEHKGEGRFSIQLLDGGGNVLETIVDKEGAFSGSKAVAIESESSYALVVEADGDWTLDVGMKVKSQVKAQDPGAGHSNIKVETGEDGTLIFK